MHSSTRAASSFPNRTVARVLGGMLWLLLFCLPLCSQALAGSARNARVTGISCLLPPNQPVDARGGLVPDSLARLDTGLTALGRAGASERTRRQWLGGLEPPGFNLRSLLWWAALVLGPILAVLIGFLFWNRSLRHQVQERTQELTSALRELRRSQGNLAEAQRLSGLGSLEVSPADQEAYWSDELYRIFGYEPQSVPPFLGTILERVHPEDRGRVQEITERVFKTGQPQQLEHRILFPDDTERVLMTQLKVVCSEGATAPKLLGTCQDITERRQHEDSLRQTQRLESLGVLAGGIAHDFNNLLAGIQGNLSLAQGFLSTGHPAQGYLKTSEDTIQRAANLARQMLAYSGRGVVMVRLLQLNTLIQEMMELLQVTLPKKVEIRFNLDPDLPCIEADENQMQQVVMNLVTNAAEAIGDREGTITLTTRRATMDASSLRRMELDRPLVEGAYVLFEVADTGSGMDAVTLERIFEPFFTTKFSGRGLGLSAIQGILRGHGAGIRIQSALGQGTRFCLGFPAREKETSIEIPSPGASHSAFIGTVLLAEDDPTVREATRELLESLGCTVLEASDGEEAVAIYRERAHLISVIILDLTMPRMDGREALREIHRIRPGAPVILTSGHNELEALQEMDADQIVGFLAKPYRFHQLEAILGKAIAV